MALSALIVTVISSLLAANSWSACFPVDLSRTNSVPVQFRIADSVDWEGSIVLEKDGEMAWLRAEGLTRNQGPEATHYAVYFVVKTADDRSLACMQQVTLPSFDLAPGASRQGATRCLIPAAQAGNIRSIEVVSYLFPKKR